MFPKVNQKQVRIKNQKERFLFKYHIIFIVAGFTLTLVPWFFMGGFSDLAGNSGCPTCVGIIGGLFMSLLLSISLLFMALGFLTFCFSVSLLVVRYIVFLLREQPKGLTVIIYLLLIITSVLISLSVYFLQEEEIKGFLYYGGNTLRDLGTIFNIGPIIKNLLSFSILILPITILFYIIYSPFFKE